MGDSESFEELRSTTVARAAAEPPVDARLRDLPFETRSWNDFEVMMADLIHAQQEGRKDVFRYGTAGQKQHGIDIYVHVRNGSDVVYQCKHYNKLGVVTLRDAVAKFREGKFFPDRPEFVLCTTASKQRTELADEIRALITALESDGVVFQVMAREDLNRELSKYPQIVERFFGAAWARRFCTSGTLPGASQTKPGESEFVMIRQMLHEYRVRSALAALEVASDQKCVEWLLLKGKALLGLDDEAAIPLLRRARAADPTVLEASTQLAGALGRFGHMDEARTVLDDAMRSHRDKSEFWRMWLGLGFPDDELPSGLADTWEVRSGRAVHAVRSGHADAESWLQLALDLKRTPNILHAFSLVLQSRGDSKAALERVDDALLLLHPNESSTHVWCQLHRAEIKLHATDQDSALQSLLQVARDAVLVVPALVQAAKLQSILGKEGEALDTLSHIPAGSESMLSHLVRARCLSADEARAEVGRAWELRDEGDIDGLANLAFVASELEELDTARQCLALIPTDIVDSKLSAIRGVVAIRAEEYEDARQHTMAALAENPGKDDLRLEYVLFLRRTKRADEALGSLREVADTTTNERLLGTLAELLLERNDYAGLKDLLYRLETVGPDWHWVWELSVRVAIHLNDVPETERASRTWLHLCPDNVLARVQLVGAILRGAESETTKESARGILTPIVDGSLPPPKAMVPTIARQLAALGAHEDAGRVLHRALRSNPEDPVLQEAMLAVLMMPDQGRPETVAVGTCVCIETDTGERTHYVLADAADVRTQMNEISVESELARRLLGRREGESIVLTEFPVETRVTIVELLYSIPYAVRWAAAKLQWNDPSGSPIREFSVRQKDGAIDLTVFEALTQQRADDNQTVLDVYDTGRGAVPLGAMGRLGRPYEVCAALARHPGPWWVAAPRRIDLQVGYTCILTRSALFTIEVLGLHDLVSAQVGKLVAPQSLHDQLNAEVRQLRQVAAQGAQSLSWDEVMRLQQVSAAEGNDALAARVHTLEWLKEVAPPTPRPTGTDRDEIWEHMDELSFDAYALAKSNGCVLFADDLGLLLLGQELGDVTGFCTYHLLAEAERARSLEQSALDGYTGQLLALGHSELPLNTAVLLQPLRANAYVLCAPFRARLAHLGQCSDKARKYQVAGRLIREVMLKADEPEPIIQAVVSLVSQKDSTSLALLQEALKEPFRFLPLHHKRARALVSGVLATEETKARILWYPSN